MVLDFGVLPLALREGRAAPSQLGKDLIHAGGHGPHRSHHRRLGQWRGAGIQADLKTFSALGVYGASVVTALTAQTTCAVTLVEPASPAMIAAQITAVFADLDVRAVKIGMLAEPRAGDSLPLVLDPVIRALRIQVPVSPTALQCLAGGLLGPDDCWSL